MDGGNGNGKDVRNMQTLATRQDAKRSAGAADRYLPAAAPLAVPAAASDLCEVRDGCGQGESSSLRMAQVKPRISTRGGLGSRRIWACVSVENAIPFMTGLRLGYGYTPVEAYAEWEES